MNSQIKTILTDLKVNDIIIPVAHFRYKGNAKTFVTWQIVSEAPSLMADDEYLYSIVSVDVDVFSDSNYSKIVNEIKKRFISNGWVWSADSAEMYEDETQIYHKTITFEKEKEL